MRMSAFGFPFRKNESAACKVQHRIDWFKKAVLETLNLKPKAHKIKSTRL
jgi:hypothetical protein